MLTRLLENWPYKIAALVIAIALRVYVDHVNDPQTTNQINIPLALIDNPSGLVVSNATPNVTLEVSGSSSSLDSLARSSYIATVDLRGAKAGENSSLPIRVTATSGVPTDVTIQSQTPRTATVSMEDYVRRTLAVDVLFRRSAPAELSYGQPKVSPTVATVEGPQSDMQRVSRLVVYADDAIGGEVLSQGVLDGFGPIVALDSQQSPVIGVDVVPVQSEVRIPVTRSSAQKQVAINGSVAGKPGYHSYVTGIDVYPSQVSVVGSQKLLASTSTVDTEPVDISGAKADVRRAVKLDLPNGLATIAPATVTVTVHIRSGGLPGAAGSPSAHG